MREHAEEAAFLWHRRRIEIDGHRLDEEGVGRIDLRLGANLDGLAAAGPAGFEAAEACFADFPEAGESFVLAAVALAGGARATVARALALMEAAGAQGDAGLSGAAARAPIDALRPHVADWLASADPRLRRLALSAMTHHRVDPGARLVPLLSDPAPRVRARALRLAGRLRRSDLAPAAKELLAADDPDERFEAAFALALLGQAPAAVPVIDALAASPGPRAAAAIELRLLLTPGEPGRRWLRDRLAARASAAAAMAAVGIPGDTIVMPWLVARMRDPAFAVAAGVALRDLFEIAFDETGLFTADGGSLGPAFAAIDAPAVPIADAVDAWWNEGRAPPAGRPFRSLRHHRLAALRQALADPAGPVEDWRRIRRVPAWT